MPTISSTGYAFPNRESRQNVSHIACLTHCMVLMHVNNSTVYPSGHHLGRLVPPRLRLSLPKIHDPDTHLLARRALSPCTQSLLQPTPRPRRFRYLSCPLRDRRHWILTGTILTGGRGIVSCGPEQYNDSFARATRRRQGQPRCHGADEKMCCRDDRYGRREGDGNLERVFGK